MKGMVQLRDYTQPKKEVPEDVIDLLYSQLMKIRVMFRSVSFDEVATLLQFISPILLEVCYLSDGKVKISVEEDLKGCNIKANGHFEYILELDGHKVCIVVAKKDDMSQGMAQALIGDEVIADLDNVTEVYAIVTNYVHSSRTQTISYTMTLAAWNLMLTYPPRNRLVKLQARSTAF